jgi:hypothetical protein
MHGASSMALKARGGDTRQFLWDSLNFTRGSYLRLVDFVFAITDTDGSPNTAICDIIWAPVENYGQKKVQIAAQV